MKKTLTDKQKKVIDIVVLVVQIVVVILAITISAIVLANPNVGSATVSKGSTKLLPVLTDSMKGTDAFYAEHPEWKGFSSGDLIVASKPANGGENLKVGDIVTFKMLVNGSDELVTHRIIETGKNDAGNTYYYTKGDANATRDSKFLYASDVLAVYKYSLKGVGSAIYWLQKPTNFLLVIVLPLVLLFIYNIVIFVQMIMQAKLAKVKEQQSINGGVAIDEEELKRKAVEEYLASQKADSEDGGIDEKKE